MSIPQITDGFTTVPFLAILNGSVNLSGINLEEITQPGVDGVAYIDVGIRGDKFELLTVVDLDNPAAQVLEKIIYASFQGSLVQVTDHLNLAYNNILVHRVTPVREFILFTPVGGISNNAGTMLIARWILENTSTEF